MTIDYQLIPAAQQNTRAWAGGTTTQLAIWPPKADYAARTFSWRLSTATVTQDTSEFTALPGFTRILMVLSGAITLIHENHHRVHLRAFEQDFFDGAWHTQSVSDAQSLGAPSDPVVDFNLMMAPDVQGNVRALHMQAGDTLDLPNQPPWQFSARHQTSALYLLKGAVCLTLQGRALNLAAKDTLLLHEKPPFNAAWQLHCARQACLIYTQIGMG